MSCCNTMASKQRVYELVRERSLGTLARGVNEEPREWRQEENPELELNGWAVRDSEGKVNKWAIEGDQPEEWSAGRPNNWVVRASEETREARQPEEEKPAEAVKFSFSRFPNYTDDGIFLTTGNPDCSPWEESVSSSGSAQPWPKSDNGSSDKKCSHGSLIDQSTILQLNQAQKKQRLNDFPKLTLDVASCDVGSLEKVFDERASESHTGSSGKRRCAVSEDDPAHSKRRKTKWVDDDDSQLKILGPVELPDFKKGPALSWDLERKIIELKTTLIGINGKLQRSEFQDDRPENERSPSPEPIYNHCGIRTNTRESRICMKLIQKRQDIISRLIQTNPTFKPPIMEKPTRLFKKLYIPVKEYPTYNFVGPIIGPRGNTQRWMQKETGAKIQVRGRGASRIQQEPLSSNTEDLHVYIEADNQDSLDAAVAMVEELLIPFSDQGNERKLAQFAELTQLNGKDRGDIPCKVCGAGGHEHQYSPSKFHTPLSGKTNDGSIHPTASYPTEPLPKHSDSVSDSSQNDNQEANLYVANLPHGLDNNRLADLFCPYGKIISVKIVKDWTTGLSKGYGFVQFENLGDAAMAVMHMNGYKLYGRVLVVRIARNSPVYAASVPSFRTYPCPPPFFQNVPGHAWFYPTHWIPSQVPFLSSASFALNPGYSDHCGFQYQPYLHTRT